MTTTPYAALASPRITDDDLSAVPDAYEMPPAHTTDEVDVVVALARRRNASRVVLGHGDGAASAAAMAALASVWSDLGGEVVDVVVWPDRAASWLRQARRFVEPGPDLWVMTGAPAGVAQMVRRLTWSTTWTARRSLGLAAVVRPSTTALTGLHHMDGLTGATGSGRAWAVRDRRVITGDVAITR